jgi:hypothetical protein
LAFLTAADANYRAENGLLGRTVPAWQKQILEGTAPAPYVYRQGVPRLRASLAALLPIGVSALVVDLGFAVLAMAAGALIAAELLGRSSIIWGIIASTLACAACYPNDKPEAVAAVGAVLVMSWLLLTNHPIAASLIAGASVVIRPENPIVFGIAALAASFMVRGEKSSTLARGLFTLAIVGGLVYLGLARFVWWANAAYPGGTPLIMLPTNLSVWTALPGLVLEVGLLLLALLLMRLALRGPAATTSDARTFGIVSCTLFAALYVIVAIFLARSDELRVVQPIVPILTLIGFAFWQKTWASANRV